MVVRGRVVDRNGLAVAGHPVALADAAGKAVRGVGGTTTDGAGTFTIRVAADRAEALRGALEGGARVLVATTVQGKPQQASEPFDIASGAGAAPVIQLNRVGAEPELASPVVRAESKLAVDESGALTQPLVRQTLTAATRLQAASGLVSDLVLRSRPTPGRGFRPDR